MPSYWIINENDMIAHIEGLDENHHILPFRHNFDDVFVEWISEDPNIIELAPIIPRIHNDELSETGNERNGVGTGISVKLLAHSVGQVNIKCVVNLKTTKNIKKKQFQLVTTI